MKIRGERSFNRKTDGIRCSENAERGEYARPGVASILYGEYLVPPVSDLMFRLFIRTLGRLKSAILYVR